MNDGYISFILMIISLILLISGWKNSIAKDVPHLALVAFFAIWLSGMFWSIPLGADLEVQGVYCGLLFIIAGAYYRSNWSSGLYLTLAGILSGMIGYFVYYLYTLDPVLVLFEPLTDIAILLGVLTWTISRKPLLQAANLSIAFIVAELLSLRAASYYQTVTLGGLAFQDGWWMTYLCARAVTVSAELLSILMQATMKQFSFWMRGLKK